MTITVKKSTDRGFSGYEYALMKDLCNQLHLGQLADGDGIHISKEACRNYRDLFYKVKAFVKDHEPLQTQRSEAALEEGGQDE